MSSPSRQRNPYAAWRELALAVVCAWGLLDAGAIAAAKPVAHTVVIEGVRYEPEIVTVKRGDTVTWINKDPFPHTVTANGVFDSHDVPPGKSWKYTPGRVGSYNYSCTLHPNMKGTLNVE